MESNPFVYSHPVPAADVIGRDSEIAEIASDAHGGHYVTLTAPSAADGARFQ